MGYSNYELTGYVVNECITICPSCADKLNFNTNEATPIFIDTETNDTCSCENCKDEIETNVVF
ncbi:hypothetical protein [Bacillus sp. FJAT-22090]|uniref:hypothetical protein n=1 Tax=Bacillus sp. FJAT-22090 TaxID=1581038 RepID=UPI00119CEEBC|nr:hypothetical protein [Bacillus sp. FJAT-22090]